jgi:hypothetical protein
VLAIGSVVINVHDVRRAAAFWCAAHDFVVLTDPEGNRLCVIHTVSE